MKKRTSIFSNLLLYLSVILSLFFIGCATPKATITMDKSNKEQIRQGSLGVIVLVPEKRVEFAELLYRVFWLEMRENYYSFEGIWDPATFLGENFIKTLQKDFNLKAIPLWEKLDPETYSKLKAECEAFYNAVRVMGQADAYSSTSSFQNEGMPYEYLHKTSPENIHLLREVLNTDYIFELYIKGISVWDHPGLSPILNLFLYGRLIRLSDGEVLWLDNGFGASKIEDFKEFSDLERNNLELLKKHYERAVLNSLDINGKRGMGKVFFDGLFLE